jgi:hypothetical protein
MQAGRNGLNKSPLKLLPVRRRKRHQIRRSQTKMTRARKYSGKTVDEATEIALAELDAELEDVEIKVVSTGRSGILGFGGEPAEIEISLLSEGASSYDDDFEDAVDEPEDSQESSEEPAAPKSEEKSPRSRTRNRNRNRSRGRGRNGRDRDEDQQSDAPAVPAAEAGSDSGAREEKPEQSDGESSGGVSSDTSSASNTIPWPFSLA